MTRLRRAVARVSVLLAFACAFRATRAHALPVTADISYAQSAEAWSTLSAIETAKGNLAAIDSVLSRRYGTFEESHARMQVAAKDPRGFYFQAAAEALGHGEIQNPVVPELRAIALAGGTLGAGLTGKVPGTPLRARIGPTLGLGREKRVDAVSTDLIEKMPVRSGRFLLYGLDLDLELESPVAERTFAKGALALRETWVHTTTPLSSFDPEESGATSFTGRWKMRGELERQVSLGRVSAIGAHGILGPQPLPADPLPRIWDYAHRPAALPEFGAMAGAGAEIETLWGTSARARATFGWYGGYWGAGISLRSGSWASAFGSWGIEGSSAYRTLGQRIWTGSVSMAF